MKEIKQKIKWLFITGVLLLGATEISARYVLGLGDPPLYEASPIYGYRAKPNQDVRRFGNRIFYNAQGLRSEPIATLPKPGTIRVLCIGDSITFGGVQVDQAQTYPYQLQTILNQNATNFEVINASTGGWAIENESAYLRHEGIYLSKIVVLELGSHDLFQPKSPSELVGTVNFPNRKPILALEEGFFRYLIPKVAVNLPFFQEPNLQANPTKKDLERNLGSFLRIASYVKSQQAQLIVILVEQPEEFEPKSTLANYSKELLAQKTRELNIPYKNLRQDFRLSGGSKLFRDGIHPNSEGNKVMALAVAELIKGQQIANENR